jgi:NADH-quinone oxidoreductase subunit N
MNIQIPGIELVLVGPIFALFLFSLMPITQRIFRKREEQSPLLSVGWGIVGIGTALAFLDLALGIKRYAFYKAIVFDGVSIAAAAVILILGLGTLFLMRDNIATRTDRFAEKIFLILSSMTGMIITSWANDLLIMFVGIEIMSISLYILIALSREDTLSKEASFKYFLLGSFASAIFLMGMAYIFGIGRTTLLSELNNVVPDILFANKVFYIGVLLVILGMCFKVGIFPFHFWVPDIYQGSPTPLTAFMASAAKVASFVAFYRIAIVFSGIEGNDKLINLLQWLAILSMIVGNTSALLQDNLKRMLAYSSIAHSGYILVGIVSMMTSGAEQAIATSVMFYVFSYSLMTLGTFGLLGVLESHEGKGATVEDLKGLADRHPLFALAFTVLLLSMAGLPPTLGFFGKFYIFSSAISQELYWLTFWGVLNSAIGVYFYLKPVVYMYMIEGRAIVMPKQLPTKIIAALSAVGVIVMGIVVQPAYKQVEKKVKAIIEEN